MDKGNKLKTSNDKGLKENSNMTKDLENFCFRRTNDNRGEGFKIIYPDIFKQEEIYVSTSKKGVIRGMHFQPRPYNQRKAIVVVRGEITGVIFDLRQDSSTYMGITSINLTDKDEYGVIIPSQCAWGFITHTYDSVVLYSIEGKYNINYDWGIRYDSIGYNWGIENPIISDRDKRLPTLEEMIDKLRGACDE